MIWIARGARLKRVMFQAFRSGTTNSDVAALAMPLHLIVATCCVANGVALGATLCFCSFST
jgi:hypothetical protein